MFKVLLIIFAVLCALVLSPALLGLLMAVLGILMAFAGALLGGAVAAFVGLSSLVGVNVCHMDHRVEGSKHSYRMYCGTNKPEPQKKSF